MNIYVYMQKVYVYIYIYYTHICTLASVYIEVNDELSSALHMISDFVVLSLDSSLLFGGAVGLR